MLKALPWTIVNIGIVAAYFLSLKPTDAAPTPRPTPRRGNMVHQAGSSFSSVGPRSATVGGFAIALVPHNYAYTLGKPIYIGLYFENETRRYGDFDPKSIQWQISGMHVRLHALRRGDSLFLTHFLNAIPPNKSISNEVDLTNFVDLPQSGTYMIRATVTVEHSGQRLTSPPVSIQVK